MTCEGATGWRERAYERFKRVGIDAFSPMRFKVTVDGADQRLSPNSLLDAYSESVMHSTQGIIHRDFADLTRSSLIFTNLLGATKVSIGTMMEVGAAFSQRKLMVTLIENAKEVRDEITSRTRVNPHDHAFFVGMAKPYIFDDEDEAILAACELLLPA